jgi:hypothetical protein
MRRGAPLKRGKRLRRGKPLRRGGPLPLVSRKRAAQVRERRAMLRAKYPGVTLCEVPLCNRVADDAHEPKFRSRLGSITDPENVRAICRQHHDWVHENPFEAHAAGLAVHSWETAGAVMGDSDG